MNFLAFEENKNTFMDNTVLTLLGLFYEKAMPFMTKLPYSDINKYYYYFCEYAFCEENVWKELPSMITERFFVDTKERNVDIENGQRTFVTFVNRNVLKYKYFTNLLIDRKNGKSMMRREDSLIHHMFNNIHHVKVLRYKEI